MADYSAGSATVEIKPNFDGFVRKLREELESIDASITIDVNVDTEEAARRLDELARRREAEIDIDLDAETARANLDALTRARIAEIEARILGREAAQRRLDELTERRTAEIDARIDGIEERRAQLDLLARARYAEIIVRTQGIAQRNAQLDELARLRIARLRAQLEGGSEAAGQLSRLESAVGRLQGGLSALSGAARFSTMAAGAAALAAALLGAAGAAGGLVAAFGAIGATGLIGSHGIVDAFSAAKSATEGASAAAEKHTSDLDAVTDAQQRVIDAQHNESEALQKVEDAQKSLTQARKDAKDTIDNLNLSVKDGALSERGAELAYRRAVVNLDKVRKEAAQGKATSLDVETAQLSVDQAAQNITDVKVKNQQTERKATEANDKGVEGSDQVQAAQKSLADAQYSVQQAQVATAQAVRELAKAQAEAAKSASEAAGGTDKFAQAMAKLAPSAQDFVRQMQALGPQWTDLRKAVQENLFSGLGDSVTTFAQHQLPALKDGLSQLATGMNGAIKDTLTSLDTLFTALTNNGAMQAFINGTKQAMEGMAPFISGLTSAFITLGAEIGPHLAPLFTALGQTIASLAGPLGEIGGTFLDTLTSIMPTLTQLVSALAEGLQPVLPVVGTLLNAVGQALIPLVGPFSQIAQIVGNALAQAITALAPYLPPIAQAFADVLAAVSPLIAPLAQLIGIIAGTAAQAISALANALAPVIKQLADGLQPVLPIIANAFSQLAPVFSQIAQTLGQALSQALEKIAPELPGLATSFTNLIVAVAPLLPKLVELAVQILPILSDILVAIAPYVEKLLDKFTDLVNFVVPKLIPAIDSLKDTIVDGWSLIKLAWDAMKEGLTQLHDKFSDLIGKLKDLWTGFVDSVEKPFKAGGGVANKLFGSLLDKVTGHADGGFIEGPGTSTSDSIVARLSNGEYVVNAASTSKYRGLIDAINADALPGFAAGGVIDASGQPDVVKSMASVVSAHFPGMQLTSGQRNTNDWHGRGKAADFSNGTDDTPEMQSLASFIATNFPNSLELIHSPFSHNLKNGQDVGDGMSLYGAQTMSEHRNHVHWAIASVVTDPSAAPQSGQNTPNQSGQNQDTQQGDQSNYSPTGTYVGPTTVDTTKDQAEANKSSLPEKYSLQGIFSSAGTILANGILNSLGLQDSILSSSNTYNKAVQTTADYYNNKNKSSDTSGGTPATTTPATTTPATGMDGNTSQATQTGQTGKHTYDPNQGAEQWRSTVVTVLQGTGRNINLADRGLTQIRIESGGNPEAQNNTDANAANGTPSIGLLQVIKPTFDAYLDSRFPGTQKDPEANIAAAWNYVDKRYGGAEKIWPTTTGYASGGWVFGKGTSTSDSIPAWLSHGEFVVNAQSAQANADWLQAVNSGATVQSPSLPAGFSSGGPVTSSNRDHSVNFYGDTHVMNPSDLVRAVDRHVEEQSMGALAAYS